MIRKRKDIEISESVDFGIVEDELKGKKLEPWEAENYCIAKEHSELSFKINK
jgi:hypothetical protein